MPDPGQDPGPAEAAVWSLADRLIEENRTDVWLRSRQLSALVAERRYQRGQPLTAEARSSVHGAMTGQVLAEQLLSLVRSAVSGSVLVMKGPELAHCYPRTGLRTFGDVDVIVEDAVLAARELESAGFTTDPDHPRYLEHHHLPAMRRPPLRMPVEVHHRPGWVAWSRDPTEEILAASRPSRTGLAGVQRPRDQHHALLVAVHAWRTRPYAGLRDLLDIWLLTQRCGVETVNAVAESWELGRLWRATWAAVEALVAGTRRRPVAVRVLGRHLTGSDPAVPARPPRAIHLGGLLVTAPPRALWRRGRPSDPALEEAPVE